MARTCAAVVLLPAAAALMLMALHVTAAAAVGAPPAPTTGLPGCDTTCGGVPVPYPFGFGPSHCYWPGLNLTCDTTHHPPRLLLGDGTLRVTDISIEDATVRVVMRARSIINTTGGGEFGWNVSFGRGFTEHGYWLSQGNELVVSGCNAMATLVAGTGAKKNPRRIIGGCATFCTSPFLDVVWPRENQRGSDAQRQGYCSSTTISTDTSHCCQSYIYDNSPPTDEIALQAKRLYCGNNHTTETPMKAFVVEHGWVDQNSRLPDGNDKTPLLLSWSVARGLPEPLQYKCTDEVSRMLCKSEHSFCWPKSAYPAGYMCYCEHGFDGNPYLAGGCQDINECKIPLCFGECNNTIGSYDCRCPHGNYGNPFVRGGCIKSSTTTAAAAGALLPMSAPAQIGLPGCNTTCGEVSVPYPFGISPGCYWPGFNLICDTSDDLPRLLLNSNSTFEVINISLSDSTVRVTHRTSTVYNTANFSDKRNDEFELLDMSETYMLSNRNELILFGCEVQATLHGEGGGSNTSDSIISQCMSTCSSGDRGAGPGVCSGRDGCCHAPIYAGSKANKVNMEMVDLTNQLESASLFALISEEGLTDQWYNMISNWIMNNQSSMPDYITYPLVLLWAVKQDVSMPTDNSGQCPQDVASRLCKSQHSDCQQENGGFTCYCSTYYHGNPYIADGCRDMCNITAEHNPCYGECTDLPGGYFECRCPQGTHGNPFREDGCTKSFPGLIIGLSIASGPTLLLLVLSTILILRKIKKRRIKLLKQKYFMQNRGQLLQQLVSQKADIAERMIIPVDELSKATNNFDKARELGGGGHGTVYKGILSDLHVVAIKKSKIAVQKEIDEFINEVAILSQINHKNVVKLFGCCLETEVPLLVYEFISNGTLYHHLHVEGPRSLSWGNRLRIATEIATSISYLHSSVSIPIIHRDIKSSNILLDDTFTSKVSDFGASRYIPIEKTGLTTRVQGTIGYLDPMYFYTSRLTEKSDVYSFGVILVELLTRKKPFSYLSTQGNGLVAHFVDLLAEGNLVQIIDPQVIEEGGEEVQEVAALAASCVNMRGEKRPTMRQVEHTLEGLRGNKKYKEDDTIEEEYGNLAEEERVKETSRRYSLEQEMMMSSRYPR